MRVGDVVVVLKDTINTVGFVGVIEGVRNGTTVFVNLGSNHNGHDGLGYVMDDNGDTVKINHRNGRWFLSHDIELHKETKVLRILKEYESKRQGKIRDRR